ncbi:hypothetical protein GLOIN_2v1785612 [Rhizophagus irregularis DAOM 181602=DAOM 197198]|uniref:C2H2-type domain-containing protein n=1 Tax=Rhizophagus irregularis (strain DAOM 181602 / DAOM 197198 / MUCL 43194) TaxID=747089 RepID=A0A2P4P9Y7_RHIID|nr:hypothetical protein GLOIN_2v1785612 [Rhizophagus irregularis DAOM 181602=DAOM 197198]POG62212.1 hypothetical protein GLOIN_2v1785612 [Rhizophagus irregularis DAOM 181602=DAOM 197198]|eukprot:XP_025169078.1 hypothetical protein GLOIN_2v1785612 [Rhizophagus irregularis DAOM 181602=DAOM 197198]
MVTSNRVCDRCGKAFATPQKFRGHQNRKFQCKPAVKSQDPTLSTPQKDNEWFADMQGDYKGRLWQADLKPNVRDIPYFPSIIADTRQKITEILKSELEEKGQIKSAITILATYTENIGTYKQVYHRGVMCVLLLKNDIDGHLTKTAVEIEDKIVKFMKEGSGWKIVSIDVLTIEMYKLDARKSGGHYGLKRNQLRPKKWFLQNTRQF